MDTSILNHHTAGLEDQLGCEGIAILEIALLSGFLAFLKLVFLPRLRLAKN